MVDAGSDVRKSLLGAASESIILPKELDISAQLARHNLLYGMGRVIWALRQIDRLATSRFYASPDFTITRTPVRWGSGFSYGGILEIRDCSVPIVFPELRPNTCGATLCTADGKLCADDFVQRVVNLRFASGATNWDYGRRNHFVNLYRSAQSGRLVVAVHGCLAAAKADTNEGPGLFFDRSDYWRARTRWIKTPLGPFATLLDRDALDFVSNYQRCEQASKEERLKVARQVGGEGEVLVNETHEGMASQWVYIKGCQIARDFESTFPVFTEIGTEAYLVSAVAPGHRHLPSLPEQVVGVLPHGTGYEITLLGGQLEILDRPDRAVYVARSCDGVVGAYADFSHIPYRYRPSRTVASWETCGYLKIVDRLLPVAFTKL